MGLSLHASRFGQAEHKRNEWHVIMPAGEPFESCLAPGYWAHVAAKMRPGDEITVINDEMSIYAKLMVRQAERIWASVVVIHKTDLGTATPEVSSDDYKVEVEWAGPHDKHRVIRLRGDKKEVLSKGHETSDSAQKWATDHMRTVNVKRAA